MDNPNNIYIINYQTNSMVVDGVYCEECSCYLTPLHNIQTDADPNINLEEWEHIKAIRKAVCKHHTAVTEHSDFSLKPRVNSLRCCVCQEILVKPGEYGKYSGKSPEGDALISAHDHGTGKLYIEFC